MISRIINNRIYVGDFEKYKHRRQDTEVYMNIVEPIITRAMWEDVEKKKEKNKQSFCRDRVYIFFQNPVPQIRRNRAGKTNIWQDYSSMFVFTLANFVVVIPYLLAFFAMFNVGLQSEGDAASLLRSGMTILGFFAGAVAWWLGLTFTIDYFRRRFRPRHMLTINHVAGVIIGVLGVYTIISTFFDIIPA